MEVEAILFCLGAVAVEVEVEVEAILFCVGAVAVEVVVEVVVAYLIIFSTKSIGAERCSCNS